MAAAVVAGVAGAAAVLTAAAIPAVVAGVASALVAVLVLVEDPERDDTRRSRPQRPGARRSGAAGGRRGRARTTTLDPLRELFEAGPAAGGSGLLGAEFVPTTLRGPPRRGPPRAAPALGRVLRGLRDPAPAVVVGAPVATDAVATVLRRTLRDADVSGHLDDTRVRLHPRGHRGGRCGLDGRARPPQPPRGRSHPSLPRRRRRLPDARPRARGAGGQGPGRAGGGQGLGDRPHRGRRRRVTRQSGAGRSASSASTSSVSAPRGRPAQRIRPGVADSRATRPCIGVPSTSSTEPRA